MSGFWSYDGPFMKKLDRLTDLLGLGVITIICCIPIITIGAAITAMYHITLRMAYNEDGKVIKPFFKSFIQNFKQSTILWLIVLLVLALVYGDYYIVYQSGLEFSYIANRIVTIGGGAVALTCTFAGVYMFPLQARFQNTTKNTIKNAFVMSVLQIPKTILLIIINLLPIAIGFVYPILWPVVLMVEFSISSYLGSLIYAKSFERFTNIPSNANETEDILEDFKEETEENFDNSIDKI